MNENIPEFHGNPNDLVFNPDYVFKLREEIEQLKADKRELAEALESLNIVFKLPKTTAITIKDLVKKHKEKTE